jgi:hypothetical protein
MGLGGEAEAETNGRVKEAVMVGRFGLIDLGEAALLPGSLHSAGRRSSFINNRARAREDRPAPVRMTDFLLVLSQRLALG